MYFNLRLTWIALSKSLFAIVNFIIPNYAVITNLLRVFLKMIKHNGCTKLSKIYSILTLQKLNLNFTDNLAYKIANIDVLDTTNTPYICSVNC